MTATLTLRCCIASALLLQACATRTAAPTLAVYPAQQVRHSSNDTAEAYYQLGRAHQAEGNLELALSGYNYAIARNPRHMEARNAAAAIHARQGRLDQARALMLTVVADYPAASQAHNNLGYIDYLRGAHAGAAQEIRHALALDPANARARNNLVLVESALAAAKPDTPPSAPEPVSVAVAPPAPRPSQLELVQVIPNVYELKMPKAVADLPMIALRPATMPVARLEIANGDGTPGLARRMGTLLGKHGFPVARLTNETPFGQRTTRILYRAGYAAQAEALRVLIDGPVLLAPVEVLAARADLRVVLGRDTQRALALRDAADAAPQVATR